MTPRVSCESCGRRRDQDDPRAALAWVSDRDGESTTWLCPDCARAHVRDIEGKLPHDYW